MLERLDENARIVISNVQSIAREWKRTSIDADHLLLALLKAEPVCQLLQSLQMDIDAFSNQLLEIIKQDERQSQTVAIPLPTYSLRFRRILELAWQEATALSQPMVNEIHLLLGIVKEGRSSAVRVVAKAYKDSTMDTLLRDLYAALGNASDQKGDSELALTYFRRLYMLDPADARIPREYLPLLKGVSKEEKAALSRFDQYSIIDESEVVEESTITFDTVAGIQDSNSEYYRIMRIFELIFLYPEQYRELANEFGIASSGSLLLFGPTGVGKTFICRAMAGEFSRRTGKKLTFINAKLSSVLDKWVGNTEKNISKLIEIALERSPSLLLLDEIDSLGTERTDAGVRDYKVDWVNHLLLELDRLRNSRKTNLVVACTNSIDRVDVALRRRLGTPLIIPLPDLAIRAHIFRLYVERVSEAVRGVIDYKVLAEATLGFTPSDIEEVVQETVNRVWLEIVDSLAKTSMVEKRQLQTEDFRATLVSKTPTVPVSKWVKESVEHLRRNGDEAIAQRVLQAFKGYQASDDLASQMRAISSKKWFALKG